LPRRQRLGVGKQRVVDVECRLHRIIVQISVLLVNARAMLRRRDVSGERGRETFPPAGGPTGVMARRHRRQPEQSAL
jgi:hypothetical protein